MTIAKNEAEFTKLRIKKSTISNLNRIKATREVQDGVRRSVYQLIDDWAQNEVKKIEEGEFLNKIAPF